MDDQQLLVQLLTEVCNTNRELADSNRAMAEELSKMRDGFDLQRREMKTAQLMWIVVMPLLIVALGLLKLLP